MIVSRALVVVKCAGAPGRRGWQPGICAPNALRLSQGGEILFI